MAKPNRDPELELGAREIDILRAIIRAHVLTGEPVGSKTVSRGGATGLSPASVRNIMAVLEERGFLLQPHTSAGRVPTDAAYRLYVDHLMGAPRINAARASVTPQCRISGTSTPAQRNSSTSAGPVDRWCCLTSGPSLSIACSGIVPG